MEDERSRKRRRYSRELKAQIVAECEAPGASVARVAMAHGVNANIVHGWRQLARVAAASPQRTLAPAPAPAPAVAARPRSAAQVFVPVTMAPFAVPDLHSPPIVVELQRGPLTVRVTWPSTAGADLAAWTRELLR